VSYASLTCSVLGRPLAPLTIRPLPFRIGVARETACEVQHRLQKPRRLGRLLEIERPPRALAHWL